MYQHSTFYVPKDELAVGGRARKIVAVSLYEFYQDKDVNDKITVNPQ